MLCLIGWTLNLSAQSCPPEWVKYTSGDYLYDIQSDNNNRGVSETDFKNQLLNAARANLAKKVQMQVKEEAGMNKSAVDGKSHVSYTSSTRFSTDVDLKFVDTRTLYNADTKEGLAIAFIEKATACMFYRNEIGRILDKVDNALKTANNYIVSGFKERAKAEVEAVLPEFSRTEEPFFWLNFFGVSRAETSELADKCNAREQAVKQLLADLKHGTLICLVCTADLFGRSYPTLQNELKGKLSAGGCSFTDNPAEADWVIRVKVSARKQKTAVLGGITSYFAYADALITIDKGITSQRIYEDEISVKGGHTRNYTEAAREAYKDLSKRLGEILKGSTKD
ncbi:MAG: hypothetical protein K2I90_13215 [Odoribacter sp.]|nr:hypothetical protein [Odoribacter sp.]